MRKITNLKIYMTLLMLLYFPTAMLAQERTVSGKVVDVETGEP